MGWGWLGGSLTYLKEEDSPAMPLIPPPAVIRRNSGTTAGTGTCTQAPSA